MEDQNITPVVLTQRHPAGAQTVQDILLLSAEERLRSRHRCQTESGRELLLSLPRGIALKEGDLLSTPSADWWVRVQAKAEPILRVEAATPLDLLRATYHLGNRHVPLEITPTVLKLAPDRILQQMLEHLGITVTESVEPFYPELGAYGHSH